MGEKCLKLRIRLKEWPFAARLSRELHPRDGTRMHSPVQWVVTTCGFAFILREEEEAPIPYGSRGSLCTTRRRRVRRKEAFQHERIMFHVPRTHCEEHGPRRKSRARDEGTCSLFFFGLSLLLCIVKWRTGNGCQLSALLVDVRGRTRSIFQRANLRRRASVGSFAIGFLSGCEQCSMQRYNVHINKHIDLRFCSCTCLIVNS